MLWQPLEKSLMLLVYSLVLLLDFLTAIMRFTSEFITPLLLVLDLCSYGLCFPGAGGVEASKFLQLPDHSAVGIVSDGIRGEKMVDTRRSGGGGESLKIGDSNHGEEEEEKKSGNYLIQEYLVSFLPYCPNGYQITIGPDVSMPRDGEGMKDTGILSSKPGQYVLCQENGRAKIKVHSGEKTDGTKKEDVDITYWITKVEALTPFYGRDRSVLNDLVADVQEHERTKDLMDANCLPRKCPTNQLMAINTKNQMDCSSFYICIMGHHFLLHCPAGHLFSEEYGVCVEKKYSDCQVRAACNHL